ncbi:MAG: methyltransferase [Hymenobacter sp.]
MLLTITTTYQPATDLGYLLHKNPARLQSVEDYRRPGPRLLPRSHRRALYRRPAARPRPGGPGARAPRRFRAGRVRERPALRGLVVLERGLEQSLRHGHERHVQGPAGAARPGPTPRRDGGRGIGPRPRLAAPAVRAAGLPGRDHRLPLDPTVPAWGASPYYTLHLRHDGLRLQDVLSPPLRVAAGARQRQALLRGPAGGRQAAAPRRRLAAPPPRARLHHPPLPALPGRHREPDVGAVAGRGGIGGIALHERLTPRPPLRKGEGEPVNARPRISQAPLSFFGEGAGGEAHVEERGISQTHPARPAPPASGPRNLPVSPQRVLDLGCGEGRLLRLLLRQPKIEFIRGMDVSHQALSRAAQRLRLDEMPPRQRARIELMQGSLLYRDERLAGFDAAALVEVIEHLDENRLASLEAVVFGHARPAHVFVTTPNAEYNQLFAQLPAGEFRHADHRFEWTRAEFAAWATGVAERHGYQVRLEGMGEEAEG